MPLYLKNATYIDWRTLAFQQVDVFVEEGPTGQIRLFPANSFIPEDTNVIDCSGRYVTKSFANAHHHAYSALATGMPAPQKKPQNFFEILNNIWWPLDRSLDKELVEISALVTAVACAKNGVTYVIDHHSSPNFIAGSLETISKAFETIGISHLLCYEISDRDGERKALAGLEETEHYLKNRQALVGLHASFTVGDKTLSGAAAMAEEYDSGIHIHVAEDEYDQKMCEKQYGKRVVERLNDFGILDRTKSILAHCLHINETERKIIHDSKAWVVQNTESNLNNNVGFFNSSGIGDRIMLGTDGMHSDMLKSAGSTFFIGRKFDNITAEIVYRRFRNISLYLSTNHFEGYGDNNLVVFNYNPPTEFKAENFLGHFFYGLESKHICHVISNGKLIVKDEKLVDYDEESLMKTARKLSRKLWDKMQEIT